MKKYSYTILILFLLYSCKLPVDYFGQQLRVLNESSDTIVYFTDERTFNPEYPFMFDEVPDTALVGGVSIEPSGVFYDQIFFPETYFDNYPDKKGKFYLFSLDTLKKYTWKEIKEKNNYLKRYDLSLDDLDSLNWTITYP